MALSKTFPAARATSSLIPMTARELVEWTYAVQRAQGVLELSSVPQGRSQTGVAFDLLTEFTLLGCNVDRSPGVAARWGETKCHEDALTVHGVVSGMRVTPRGPLTPGAALIIEHGRQRSAPDWEPKVFPLRCVPVMGRRGSERGIYLGSGRHVVGHEITYEGDWPSRNIAANHQTAADAHMRLWGDQSNWPSTRLSRRSHRPMVAEHDWSPLPYRRCADEVLQRARDEYRAWYEALWALCDSLKAAGPRALTRYRISDLGAASEPWHAQKKWIE